MAEGLFQQPPLGRCVAPEVSCPDSAEAQPVLGSAGELLAAFNPSDALFAGGDLLEFNYSTDTSLPALGNSWNFVDGDPATSPLVMPMCVPGASGSGPYCADHDTWAGDSWSISNTHDGLDSITGLYTQPTIVSSAFAVGAATTSWSPAPTASCPACFFPAFPTTTPFAPITPLGSSDGPKAAFDSNGSNYVAVVDAIYSGDSGGAPTEVHLFGDTITRGACNGPITAKPPAGGTSPCGEIACVNVSPPAGVPPGSAVDCLPSENGSRADLDAGRVASHAALAAFAREVWVFLFQFSPASPGAPTPLLVGWDTTTGNIIEIPIAASIGSVPTSPLPCPSPFTAADVWDFCVPDAKGDAIRLASIPSLAYGTASDGTHHLYMAWSASSGSPTPVEGVVMVTYDLDDRVWPPASIHFRSAFFTTNSLHNDLMPAVAADPLGEAVALVYYSDEGTGCASVDGLPDCASDPTHFQVVARFSPNAGGFGVSDMSFAVNTTVLSEPFPLVTRFVRGNYVTDYLGATEIRGTDPPVLYATWVESHLAAGECDFNPGAAQLLGPPLNGYESQGWGNWIDPPPAALCAEKEEGDDEACASAPDASADPEEDAGGAGGCEDAARGERIRCECADGEDREGDEDEAECEGRESAFLARERALLRARPFQRAPTPSASYVTAPLVPAAPPAAFGASCRADVDCDASFHYVCLRGLCGCSSSALRCGETCTDLITDPANCGGCGHICSSGEVCNAGKCKL